MSPGVVFGIGTVVVDHLLVLPQLPAPDAKVEALADRLQVGGPVPTALAQVRRLGRRCGFAGAWGDDPYGAMVAQELADQEIDCTSARAVAGSPTGLAQVWVCRASGERSIAYRRMDPASLPFDAPVSAALARARALHLDGWPPATALAAARRARELGVLVSLDV
ncbi:MAG: carbohydrate kinase family protein, partial [Planctomycetota bacterium]